MTDSPAPRMGDVKLLNRLIAEAEVLAGGEHQCAVLGHDWISTGGCNCGCEDGHCSVPVHECRSCGDCDYGENEWADEVRCNCDHREGFELVAGYSFAMEEDPGL